MPERKTPRLTCAELSLIQEQLAQEKLMIAKFQNYAHIATDSKVRQLCHAAALKHESHLGVLLNHLRVQEIEEEA